MTSKQVVLIWVREAEDFSGEATQVRGDPHGTWYELPGKGADEVRRALLDAGFVERDGPQATVIA